MSKTVGLRSLAQPRGLSGLSGHQRHILRCGDALADRSFQIMQLAYRRGIPGVEENPRGSFLWSQRNRQDFLRQKYVHHYDLDLTWDWRGNDLHHYNGHGLNSGCGFSGRKHGISRSAVLSFPPVFCTTFATLFSQAIARNRLAQLWDHIS